MPTRRESDSGWELVIGASICRINEKQKHCEILDLTCEALDGVLAATKGFSAAGLTAELSSGSISSFLTQIGRAVWSYDTVRSVEMAQTTQPLWKNWVEVFKQDFAADGVLNWEELRKTITTCDFKPLDESVALFCFNHIKDRIDSLRSMMIVQAPGITSEFQELENTITLVSRRCQVRRFIWQETGLMLRILESDHGSYRSLISEFVESQEGLLQSVVAFADSRAQSDALSCELDMDVNKVHGMKIVVNFTTEDDWIDSVQGAENLYATKERPPQHDIVDPIGFLDLWKGAEIHKVLEARILVPAVEAAMADFSVMVEPIAHLRIEEIKTSAGSFVEFASRVLPDEVAKPLAQTVADAIDKKDDTCDGLVLVDHLPMAKASSSGPWII